MCWASPASHFYGLDASHAFPYMDIHTNTNRDPGPKADHFLEKALEVKELERHISLSTLGSPQREEDHSTSSGWQPHKLQPGTSFALWKPLGRGCACEREHGGQWGQCGQNGKGEDSSESWVRIPTGSSCRGQDCNQLQGAVLWCTPFKQGWWRSCWHQLRRRVSWKSFNFLDFQTYKAVFNHCLRSWQKYPQALLCA